MRNMETFLWFSFEIIKDKEWKAPPPAANSSNLSSPWPRRQRLNPVVHSRVCTLIFYSSFFKLKAHSDFIMSELSVWILKPYKTFSFRLIICLLWALFSLKESESLRRWYSQGWRGSCPCARRRWRRGTESPSWCFLSSRLQTHLWVTQQRLINLLTPSC